MPDTKATALSELSVPATEDIVYIVDDPSGTPVSNKVSLSRLLGLLNNFCDGRLTTESGVAVSTSDRTAQSTIYFTPFNGNRVSLYDGTRWRLYTFTERSLALSGLTDAKNYDVFLYDNSGTLTLELSAAWTNDTTRADAVTLQDGVVVKSGATTRRHLGTIRTTSTTTTEDSRGGTTSQVGGKRFVWNHYNRVPRFLAVIDTTDSWTYATDTIRQANGNSGNKVEYVVGDAAAAVAARLSVTGYAISSSARSAKAGVGVDSTSAFSGLPAGMYNATASLIIGTFPSSYQGQPGLGYHFLAWLERGADGTCVFLGDDGASGMQSGLHATIEG